MAKLKSQDSTLQARISLRRSVVAVVLGLCFSLPAVAQTADPWQNVNERIFAFNDFFDRVLVRPIAITYTTFLPRPVRQGIGNFFSNIDDINVFANDLLQLKFNDALSDSGRFALNTTVGLGGLLDVASRFGLEKNEEDFGQTLGRWGVGAGPYMVLPVFGTSNVRDSFGLVIDTLFNPIQYYDERAGRWTLFVVREIDTRSSLLALDELVGGDKYLFFREAYVQRREYLVKDGQNTDSFSDF